MAVPVRTRSSSRVEKGQRHRVQQPRASQQPWRALRSTGSSDGGEQLRRLTATVQRQRQRLVAQETHLVLGALQGRVQQDTATMRGSCCTARRCRSNGSSSSNVPQRQLLSWMWRCS